MSEDTIDLQRKETNNMISVQLEGYEVIEKEVKPSGNSGRVYLPNDWIGSRVKIIRITPLVEDKDD